MIGNIQVKLIVDFFLYCFNMVQEVNKPVATGCANVKAEAGFANGVQLLALAATEIGVAEGKKEGSLKKEQ